MKKTLVTLLLAVLITGCASNGWIEAKKMNKLTLGMPREEVVKLLGEPHSREVRPGEETLWYLEDQGGYVHQPYYVKIHNTKVEAFGPGQMPAGGGQMPPVMIQVPR